MTVGRIPDPLKQEHIALLPAVQKVAGQVPRR